MESWGLSKFNNVFTLYIYLLYILFWKTVLLPYWATSQQCTVQHIQGISSRSYGIPIDVGILQPFVDNEIQPFD